RALDTRGEVVSASVEFRKNIEGHVLALGSQLSGGTDAGQATNVFEDAGNELALEHHVLSRSLAAWQLTELVLLRRDSSLASQLLAWINAFEPQPTRASYDAVHAATATHSLSVTHPSFWPYIHKCLLRGHWLAAVALLQKHPAFQLKQTKDSPFNALLNHIQSMPKLASNAAASKAQFDSAWSLWRRSVQIHKDSSRIKSALEGSAQSVASAADIAGLVTSFGILFGDLKIIVEAVHNPDDAMRPEFPWMEALVASIWYTEPHCPPENIGTHVDSLRTFIEFPTATSTTSNSSFSDTTYNPFEQAILNLFDLQIDVAVLNHLSHLDPMISAHLIHILDAHSRLDEAEGVDGYVYFGGEDAMRVVGIASDDAETSIKQQRLLEYATSLSATSQDLVWIAIEYLCTLTSASAKTHLETLLLSIPATTPFIFRKLVSIATSQNLSTVLTTLHNKRADEMKHRNRNGEAITHYTAAGFPERAASVSQTVLKTHLAKPSTNKNTHASTHQVITQLSPTLIKQSQHLAVLSKLVSFQAFYKQKQWKQAASAAIDLLTRLPTPKWVWTRVLVDCVGLLELNECVLGVEETFEVVKCLEVVV
ncbi:Nuclear pore complex protein Nup85, partial [Rhizoclosmatium hyalinum]